MDGRKAIDQSFVVQQLLTWIGLPLILASLGDTSILCLSKGPNTILDVRIPFLTFFPMVGYGAIMALPALSFAIDWWAPSQGLNRGWR